MTSINGRSAQEAALRGGLSEVVISVPLLPFPAARGKRPLRHQQAFSRAPDVTTRPADLPCLKSHSLGRQSPARRRLNERPSRGYDGEEARDRIKLRPLCLFSLSLTPSLSLAQASSKLGRCRTPHINQTRRADVRFGARVEPVVRYLIFLARMLLYGAICRTETYRLGASHRIRRAGAGCTSLGEA